MREQDRKGRPDDEGPGNTDGAGGYAERGAARGPGTGKAPDAGDREASDRSRWRKDDPDGTSDRFEGGSDGDGHPPGTGS